MAKKQYTRSEKIEYFKTKIKRHEDLIKKWEKRISELKVEIATGEPEQQDWSERVSMGVLEARIAELEKLLGK